MQEALTTLLAAARPVTDEEVIATLSANGRVLSQDIAAPVNVPGADNSQMDGYAVDTASLQDGTVLPVSQRIAAGHPGTMLQPGTAARIFTGALMPPGANAVVMQEQCELFETGEGPAIRLLQLPKPGEWVRQVGEDIRQDSVILASGTRLRAQELGLAASVGRATLPVRRRLKVAIFFTGDELIMPGEALPQGAIYNSNRFLLTALLQNYGCEVTDYGIVPDSLAQTRGTLRQAAAGHDVVITSGGVSVGEEDHVRPAVEAEGKISLWQIGIKPGKPLAFGEVGSAFFIGLPGNPVSSFVTFLLFVRPFLMRLQGMEQVAPKVYELRADFDWPRADRRNEFLRARINSAGGLDLFANQGSAVLSSTVWGDGLIDNPAGHVIARGELVRFMPFSELMS